MDKIWLVIQREYLARARKNQFLLVTLLTPLMFSGDYGCVRLWIRMEEKGINRYESFRKWFDENKALFLESSWAVAFFIFQYNGRGSQKNWPKKWRALWVFTDPKRLTWKNLQWDYLFGEENPNRNWSTIWKITSKKKVRKNSGLFESGKWI